MINYSRYLFNLVKGLLGFEASDELMDDMKRMVNSKKSVPLSELLSRDE